jgi:hypothetical protein
LVFLKPEFVRGFWGDIFVGAKGSYLVRELIAIELQF